MRALILTAILAALALPALPASAQGVAATCRDGTTFSGTTRQGACAGHGGVQAFGTTTTPASSTPAPAGAPTTVPAGPAAQMPSAGGPGQVWVNTRSKVYHCPGDRYYGKTKQGAYMTEGAAKAAGDRPDHGKACS